MKNQSPKKRNKQQRDPEAETSGAGQDSPPRDGKIYIAPPTGGAREELLARINRAYARGDMRFSRSQARVVMAGDPSPQEREFAELILHRTSMDPVALAMGLASLAAFVLIIALTL